MLTARRGRLVYLILVPLFLLALRPISDMDFWWHLAAGRWIAESGSVPRPSVAVPETASPNSTNPTTAAVIVALSDSPIVNGTTISAIAVTNSSAACRGKVTLPLNITYRRYERDREMCVSGVTHGHSLYKPPFPERSSSR